MQRLAHFRRIFFHTLTETESEPPRKEETGCNCVQPCHRVIYDPSMSNAALSELAINSIMTEEHTELTRSVG